jgi:hypothetical protein
MRADGGQKPQLTISQSFKTKDGPVIDQELENDKLGPIRLYIVVVVVRDTIYW